MPGLTCDLHVRLLTLANVAGLFEDYGGVHVVGYAGDAVSVADEQVIGVDEQTGDDDGNVGTNQVEDAVSGDESLAPDGQAHSLYACQIPN